MRTLQPVQPYRGGYWIGWVIVPVVALLLVIYVPGGPQLLPAFSALGSFALLYLLSPRLLQPFGWFRFLYLPVQICLVLALGSLRIDGTNLLYFPICLQAVHAFSRPAALAWMLLCLLGLGLTLFARLPAWEALALVLLFLAVASFLISFDFLYTQTQRDQAESRLLLEELQAAHRRLQEHAARAEELAAERERNRLARDLHDSVSQMMFSIRLTTQALRLLLDSDPARVEEQLDHLQELTSGVLAHLRSLIAELHPR